MKRNLEELLSDKKIIRKAAEKANEAQRKMVKESKKGESYRVGYQVGWHEAVTKAIIAVSEYPKLDVLARRKLVKYLDEKL